MYTKYVIYNINIYNIIYIYMGVSINGGSLKTISFNTKMV